MRAFGGTIRVHGIDTSNPRGEVGMEQVKRTGHVVNTETGMLDDAKVSMDKKI